MACPWGVEAPRILRCPRVLKMAGSLVDGLQGARGWESASEGEGRVLPERASKGKQLAQHKSPSLWVCGSAGGGVGGGSTVEGAITAQHQTKANLTLRILSKAEKAPNVSRMHSRQRTGAKPAPFSTWPLDTHAPSQAKFSSSFFTSER